MSPGFFGFFFFSSTSRNFVFVKNVHNFYFLFGKQNVVGELKKNCLFFILLLLLLLCKYKLPHSYLLSQDSVSSARKHCERSLCPFCSHVRILCMPCYVSQRCESFPRCSTVPSPNCLHPRGHTLHVKVLAGLQYV